uniref:Plastid division protein CDP1-like IMS domain-containing protein n=1 Tax=Cyanothece sp. (strain PCC 7425 / ATCC 29141) TaxID=395961 RepID=B8HXT4_CYAP4
MKLAVPTNAGSWQPGVSSTDSYRVRYILVRQRGQWLIKDMKVIG